MDNLEPITRNEMFLNGDDLEPITREEMILAGADLEPITRHEWFLKKYRGGGGGGGYDLVNVPNLPADIASFNDGTDLPMASLKVAVTPYQDLSHGDPSPDNICPISGWDDAVVNVVGKNIIDLDASEQGGIDTNGNLVSGGNMWRSTKLDAVKPNSNIIFSCNNAIMRMYYYNIDKNFLYREQGNSMSENTFSTPSNAYFIKWTIYSGTVGDVYTKEIVEAMNLQIEFGSQKTAYVAYNQNSATYTIDLDGTRYGGVVDVVNGTMTVDRAYVDLGTLTYVYEDTETPKRFRAGISPTPKLSGVVICSSYKGTQKGAGALDNNELCISGTQAYPFLRIRDDAYTDATAFKTAVNGQQLVYELATPITVQLAPTQVKSLEGENNISADCGQITEVKYFKKA